MERRIVEVCHLWPFSSELLHVVLSEVTQAEFICLENNVHREHFSNSDECDFRARPPAVPACAVDPLVNLQEPLLEHVPIIDMSSADQMQTLITDFVQA